MLLASLVDGWDITILATDVDVAALEAARRGVYSTWALRETPAWVRARHFRPAGTRRFELSRQIREAVTFAPLNLATDAFPGSLDLIVCRNVLMYFTDAARERTVGQLRAALAPGGELVLSPLDALPEVEAEVPAPQPDRAGSAAAERAAASTRCAKARAEADRGRLEAARALCLETLRERPLDADAHLLLAAVEEERGDLDAAIWALRRAIYTAPDGAGGALPARRPAAAQRGVRRRPAQPRHRRRAARVRAAGRARRRR